MRLSTTAHEVFRALAQTLRDALPPHCALCGLHPAPRALCARCREDLPGIDVPRCRICAIRLEAAEICGPCTQSPPPFARVITASTYAFPIDTLIQRFKYAPDLTLAAPLGTLLAQRVADLPRPDLIVPMPLSAERIAARGFNQAAELCKCIGAAIGVPVAVNVCRRTRDTAPQTSLAWDARARNVRGAFECAPLRPGARIAVVDDVLTTGATLAELASTIRSAGASEVVGWVVARTEKPDRA